MIKKRLTPDEIWATPDVDPVAQFQRNYETNAEQRRQEHNRRLPGVGMFRSFRDNAFWPTVYAPIAPTPEKLIGRIVTSALAPAFDDRYTDPNYQSPWENPTSIGAVARNIGKQSLRMLVQEGQRRADEFTQEALDRASMNRFIVLDKLLAKLDKIKGVGKNDPASEQAKTALAKQLMQQGVDPDEIWKQTGRELIDGRWFGEIDPVEIDPEKIPTLEKDIPKWILKLSPEEQKRPNARNTIKAALPKKTDLKQEELIANTDNPIYTLYPQWKNHKISYLNMPYGVAGGTAGKNIYLNTQYTHKKTASNYTPIKTEDAVKNQNMFINHEGQHKLDIAARLPRGGSDEIVAKALKENQVETANALAALLSKAGVSDFNNIPAELQEEYKALKERAEYLDSLKGRSDMDIYSLMWDEMMARINETRSQKTAEWRRNNRPTRTPDYRAKNTGMEYPDFSKALR